MPLNTPFKTLYFLLLTLCQSHSFSMNLVLEPQEDSIFPIKTYPFNLQCKVFESMLPHLNTYQTTFFEDEQKKDTEEIQKIGVLRYQIACFMIEHLLKNSIQPQKIPHSMAVIKDILYRGVLFIPYAKMKKMNELELLKNALKYQQLTQHINHTPSIFSDIFLQNIQTLSMRIKDENFCYPGRPNIVTILKEDFLREFQDNTIQPNEPIKKMSHQIIIAPKDLPLIIAISTVVIIVYASLFGIKFLIEDFIYDS